MARLKNVFCDFANKEIRRLYGLYRNLSPAQHVLVLQQWLNIGLFLSADWCLIPLGFAAESEVLQKALRRKEAYLLSRSLRLSVRDREIETFILRRRDEYLPAADDYSPLYRDETIEFLKRYAVALMERGRNSGNSIVQAWAAGPDINAGWLHIAEAVGAKALQPILQIPGTLTEQGLGVTWNAVNDRLSLAEDHRQTVRSILHHDFVQNYLTEYDLEIISRLPFGWRDLGLRPLGGSYDFEAFQKSAGPIAEMLQLLSAQSMVNLRQTHGYGQFLAAHHQAFDNPDPLKAAAIFKYSWGENAKVQREFKHRLKSLYFRESEWYLSDDLVEHLGFVLGEVASYTGRDCVRPQHKSDASILKIEIGRIDMGDKIINIGAGAQISAPVVVADAIERSLNTLSTVPEQALKSSAEALAAEVADFAKTLPAEKSKLLTEDLEAISRDLVASHTSADAKSSAIARLERFASYASGFGTAATAVIAAVQNILKLFG